MSSHYPCPSSSSEMAHADVEIGTNMAPSQEHVACGTILENYKDPNIAPEEENIKFDNVPEDLSCSISLDIFKEPVLASDGFVYERSCIEDWFRKSGTTHTSPRTGESMPNTCLRPNNEMIAKVKEWKKKQYTRVVERIEGEERMLMNLNRSICASWQRKVELEKMKHALKGEIIEGMEISNSTSVSDTSTSTNVGGDDSNSTHVSDASEDEDEGRKFFDPESDAHIRTEYNDYTEFFSDDDIITRTEFKRTGVTVHYEGNKKKKVEFFSPHEQEGAVDYYETSSSKNKMVHTEFYPPHKRAGVQQGYHGNGKAKRNVPIPGYPEKCIVRNDVPKKKSDEGRRTPKRGHAAKPNETVNVKQPSPKKQKKELVKQKVVKRKDPPNF
ncbi:hypothetical protein TrRE_jg5776, partial [Triparma retinervis]